MDDNKYAVDGCMVAFVSEARSKKDKGVEINGIKHALGYSDKCNDCWYGFPVKCKCGGHIHSQLIERSDHGLHTKKRCDNCDFEEELNEK